MNTGTAIRLISQLQYKPGWKFEPTDNTHRYENSVAVKITYPAVDSGRENAANGYAGQEINGGARAAYPILLDRIDRDEDLYAELLRAIYDIEHHEAREFLRVSPTLWAPFHPHNTDGMERAERQGLGTLKEDLTFGLV